jgi:lipopolysaccharide biosynthesis glycosyltransferase
MTKALVTACNLNHAVGAEALLRGIAKFHPDVHRYCYAPTEEVALLHQRLGNLAKVLPPPREIQGSPKKYQIALARLFAVTLPADVVVYMDSDVIICRPAPELWEVAPDTVNAIQDQGTKILDNVPPQYRDEFSQVFTEASLRKGFNSGVLGLRPHDWRDLPAQYEQLLAKLGYKDNPPMTDQPLLNVLLLDHVRWLSAIFNFHSLFENRIPRNVRIVHFAASQPIKPWMAIYPKHEMPYYYWVKYGLGERRLSCLLPLLARIVIMAPKRLMGRVYRKLFPPHAVSYSGPVS